MTYSTSRKITLFILLVFCSLLPLWTMAEDVATDDFESYSAGDLHNGAGGTGWATNWSGSALFDVQTSIVNSGTNAVTVTPAGSEPQIARTFTGMANGTSTIYFRRSSGTNIYMFEITEGGALKGRAMFKSSGNFDNLATGGDGNITSLSFDTWYKLDMEWRADTDQVRYSIDDGAFTSWLDTYADFTTIDGFRVNVQDGGGMVAYFDDISISDNTAVEAPPETATTTTATTTLINNPNQDLFNGLVLFFGVFWFVVWFFKRPYDNE